MKVFKFVGKFYGTFIGTVIFLGILTVVFFLTFPFKPAEFKRIDIKNQVTVGGIIEYTNTYCQNVGKGTKRDLDRYLIAKDPTLVDPIKLSDNPTDETLKDAGCRTSLPIKLTIDSSTPEGDYKLLVKACYYVFFSIRCVPVSDESDYFHISKPDILGQLTNINSQLESINGYLSTNPNYIPVQPNPSVSSVAPSTSSPTAQNSTTEQRSGILESTIDSINGILTKVGQ